MTTDDRIRWNKKHHHEAQPAEPSPIVVEHLRLVNAGRALDVAAGNGRNSLYLAEQGFEVDAVDISDEALTKLAKRHANLHPVCADLDDFNIPKNRYRLILNIRFLNRRLFPYIKDGLVSGGVLIFETYLYTPTVKDTDPMCRDYLLRSNELLHAFLPLNILYYREGSLEKENESRPVASLVAVKG